MRKLLAKHHRHWTNKDVSISSATGVAVFLFSLMLNYYASIYATEKAGSAVPDLIISNVRVFNVDFVVYIVYDS